jgi:hypothetical protein
VGQQGKDNAYSAPPLLVENGVIALINLSIFPFSTQNKRYLVMSPDKRSKNQRKLTMGLE